MFKNISYLRGALANSPNHSNKVKRVLSSVLREEGGQAPPISLLPLPLLSVLNRRARLLQRIASYHKGQEKVTGAQGAAFSITKRPGNKTCPSELLRNPLSPSLRKSHSPTALKSRAKPTFLLLPQKHIHFWALWLSGWRLSSLVIITFSLALSPCNIFNRKITFGSSFRPPSVVSLSPQKREKMRFVKLITSSKLLQYDTLQLPIWKSPYLTQEHNQMV